MEEGAGGVLDDDDGMGRSLVRQIGIVGVLSGARILGSPAVAKLPVALVTCMRSFPPPIPIRRMLLAGDVGLLARKQPSPWMVSLFSLIPFLRW